jgi:hypothetical protein
VSVKIRVDIEARVDIKKHLKNIRSDAFWTYAASEWHRLYDPYVPMETGALKDTVMIRPREIEHTVPYAHRMYEGHFHFRKHLHPKASRKWDKAAAPTQRPKLIRSLQAAIDSGRFDI